MKNLIILAFSALVLATGCATREVRELRVADLNDLPFAVRQTILEAAPTGDIAKVDRHTYTGRSVYEVTFHDPIAHPHLSIASDGTLISGGGARLIREPAGAVLVAPTTTLSTVGETRFEDLPHPVQNAILMNARSGRIVDIDKEMRPAQTVYEVQFSDPGLNPKLHIREDGVLVDGD